MADRPETPNREWEGWDRAPHADLYELSPSHPKYPQEWRNTDAAGIRDRLDEDEQLQALLQLVAEGLQEDMEVIRDLSVLGVIAARLQDLAGDNRLRQQHSEMIARLDLTLLQIALKAGPVRLGVTPELLVAYVADRLLPPSIGRFWSAQASPVSVIANAEETEVMTIPLYPGEVLVKINNVLVRDIAPKLGPLIKEGQKISGKQKQKGRRPTLDLDSRTAPRARRTAELRRRGHPDAEIAKAIEILRTGEIGTERRVRLQLEKYIAAGEKVLARERGEEGGNPSDGKAGK